MPGTKRSSTGGEAAQSKKPKTEKEENGTKSKTSIVKSPAFAEKFKSASLPLHFGISHTPPSVEEEGSSTSASKEKDEGSLGHITALPTTFSTGTLGWKGSKRLTIELEVGEDGKKEKVPVMISINATVLGSKPSPEDAKNAEKEGKKGNEEGEALKAAAEEAVEEDDSD